MADQPRDEIDDARLPARSGRPLLIYDGACGFCIQSVGQLRRVVGERVGYAPFQEVERAFPGIPSESFRAAVQLVEPSGRVFSGAAAIFRVFALVPGRRWLSAIYFRVPGAAPVADAVYRFIAARRGALPGTRACGHGACGPPRGDNLTRWVFLRGLAVVYLIAFVSLRTQIVGLVGQRGILPAQEYLERVAERVGEGRYAALPTLFWIDASDAALRGACDAGAVLSALLLFDVAPAVVLGLLWAGHLSLTLICQDFLGFQWDNLLLETGFLALFYAPLRLRPRRSGDAPPSAAASFLLRFLLFKLMFASGVVKLTARTDHWRDFSALTVHYETQPLPPWTAWYVHQLPEWFHQASMGVMFGIELLVPFFLFGPRRGRIIAAAVLATFQLLIIVTGNYCFFNLLMIVLCVAALDDRVWPRSWSERFAASVRPRRWWLRWPPAWLTVPLAGAYLLLSFELLTGAFRKPIDWSGPAETLWRRVEPFRSVNSYGLFADMTVMRPEIILEGSRDGREWKAYEFRYKPGDLSRRPAFVAPHQPRLDWQMWFAALRSDCRYTPWYLMFCRRLLEGSPDVAALLADNPFPDAPPMYLRSTLVDYRFTDWAEGRETGHWWRRGESRPYCPLLSQRSFGR